MNHEEYLGYRFGFSSPSKSFERKHDFELEYNRSDREKRAIPFQESWFWFGEADISETDLETSSDRPPLQTTFRDHGTARLIEGRFSHNKGAVLIRSCLNRNQVRYAAAFLGGWRVNATSRHTRPLLSKYHLILSIASPRTAKILSLPAVPMASRKPEAASSDAGVAPKNSQVRSQSRPLLLLALLVTLALAFSQRTPYQLNLQLMKIPLIPSSLLTLDHRVDRLMARTPLIDGHIDLAERLRSVYSNHIYTPDFKSKFEVGGLTEHLDIQRMKEGKQGGFFWSCWVDCPRNRYDFSNENYAPVIVETLSQLDVIHRLQGAYPEVFSPATLDSASALSEFRRTGKFLSPIGLEGLHMVGRNASTLRLYHKMGMKYATLTWNCHNAIADAAQVTVLDDSLDPEAAQPAKPYWGGLSPLGVKMIRELNRLGVMIDLSHTHPTTMLDVLAGNKTKSFSGSKAPVIFSHSSAYALCPHPRNVPDEVLTMVKQTKSVVMVTFVPQFISCVNSSIPGNLPTTFPANSTLEFVVEHILYIGKKIGFEHVGLGSDYCGIPDTPKGLEDVTKFPDLVRELCRRGLRDSEIEGIIGGNVLRVWKRVEEVSAEMQVRGELPMEDEI